MDILKAPFRFVGNVAQATGQLVKDVAGVKDEERQPIRQLSEEDQRKQLALQAERLRLKREQLAYEAEQRQLKMQQAQMDREQAIERALNKGNAALETGEYETAWVQFKNVLIIDPHHSAATKGASVAQEKLGQKAIGEGDYLNALKAFVKGNIDVEIRGTVVGMLNRAQMEEERADRQARNHALESLQAALKIYEEQNQLFSDMKQIIPRERFSKDLSSRSDSLRLKIDSLKDKIHVTQMKNKAAVTVKEADQQLEIVQKEYDAQEEHSRKDLLDFQKQLEDIQKSYGVARSLDPDCSVTQEERLGTFLQEVDAHVQKSNLTHLQKCLAERSLRDAQDLDAIINLCKSWEGSYQRVRKSRHINSKFKLEVKPTRSIIQQIGVQAHFAKTKLDNLEQDFSKIVNQAIQDENIRGKIPFKKLEALKKEYRAIFDKNQTISNMYVALNEAGRVAFEGSLDSQLASASKRGSCFCFSSNEYKFSPKIPFSETSLSDLLSSIARTNSVEDIRSRLKVNDSSSDEDEGSQVEVEGEGLRAPSTVASAPPLETTM